MDAIWILLLKELVLPAVKDAIGAEIGAKELAIAELVVGQPKRAAQKIADNEQEMLHIKDGLTNIFRAILRVFK